MPYPAGPKAPGEWREQFFDAFDGTRLFHAARILPSPKAVVVIVHGYADHCLRYRHVIDELAVNGYTTHTFDYRGHGQAGGRRGYCQRFSDYTNDLTTFLLRVRKESPAVPLYLLAHSHGCLVSASLLLSHSRPKDIAGVIFSSPYFRLKIEPSAFQLFQAKIVGRILPIISVKNPLTEDMLTHDPAFLKAIAEDELRHHVVTPTWFTASNAAQVAVLAGAPAFKDPLLMMIGEEDPVAAPSGGEDFFRGAGSPDKQLIKYPHMLHEIFNEVERQKPIGEVVRWLNDHVQAKAATA
jgi:alpha-beta hydrolase superfamily lysophospholipase